MLTAFDGTDFHGWQAQPGVRTVQEVLQGAVVRVVRHPVVLYGSGRTDAGVHAAGHVTSFRTTHRMPVDRMIHAIGSRLPKDLSIREVRSVHPEFHATTSATSKLYRYRLFATHRRPVNQLAQRYAYHVWHKLDVDRLRDGARHFVGTMDFTAMAATGTVRTTMVRTVIRCDIDRHGDEIRMDVEGDGFLHHQVRNMVGTLIEVGRGHWEPDYVREIIDGCDRSKGGPTAPAHGLSLQWVKYPGWLLREPVHTVEMPASPCAPANCD